MAYNVRSVKQPPKKLKKVFIVLIAIFAVLVVLTFVFRQSAFVRKLVSFLMIPINFILGLFGVKVGVDKVPFSPIDPLSIVTDPLKAISGLAGNDSTETTIVKHEIAQCPPCSLTCPETPQCDNGPLELEIRYLKNMLKFVGSISRRENAINAQYRELYPGFSVMSPTVQRMSTEYNFLKNQIREDENEWTYFKNYFTKLTNIPSNTSTVHYDLMM
jgi:hypothetical protein